MSKLFRRQVLGLAALGICALGGLLAGCQGEGSGPFPPVPVLGVTSLTFPSGTFVGGQTITGTITLGAPAGVGGVLVTLNSSSGSVVVPVNVTVPQGFTSATFTATTSPVTGATTAVITATGAGASQTFTITLVPSTTGATGGTGTTGVR